MERDNLSRILKWIGAATAVISLILGARQLITVVTENNRRNREAAEFVALAQQQASRGDFAASWTSLGKADERVKKPATDEARLDIAFRWLQDGRPGPDQPFSRITDAVVPALDRALLDPAYPRRADVLAHLGWATFLKSRDTGVGDPMPQYEQALAIDRTNVYANTMMAHWLSWHGEPLDKVGPYYDAALATGKERPLVRTFQLASLLGRHDDAAEVELVRVANSMRQQHETIDARTAGALHAAFVRRYGPNAANTQTDPITLPPAEQLATYQWVIQTPGRSDRPEIRDYVVAMLMEASGNRPGALEALRALLPKLGGRSDEIFRTTVTRQIQRLQRETRRE